VIGSDWGLHGLRRRLSLWVVVVAAQASPAWGEPTNRDAPRVASTPPTPAEVLELWEEYLSEIGETVCEIRGEFFVGTTLGTLKKDESDHRRFVSRAISEGYLYETNNISPTTGQVTSTLVRGANRHYAFSLNRQSNGAVELWELDAESSAEELADNFEGAQIARSWVTLPFCTFHLDITLLQVFRHESFRLKDVTETAEGNWRFDFDCDVPSDLGGFFYGPAKLILQRDGYRLPISLQARMRSPLCESTLSLDMVYADTLGLPRVSRFRSANENICDKERSAGSGISHITWRRPTDEDRMTLYLSHYGLPEPTKPSRINWWIMLGGALLLAGIYRLISRRDRWVRT